MERASSADKTRFFIKNVPPYSKQVPLYKHPKMDDHLEGEGEELRLFRALLGNLCFFSLRAEVSKHADKTKAIAKFLAIALVFALHLWYIM